MIIRNAVEADVPALQRLLRASWLATWAPELAFATVQRFAAEDPAGRSAVERWRGFVVADEDRALLGMFHTEGDPPPSLPLHPNRTPRRIGTALMDEIERRIGAVHAQASLEVRAFNTGAIAFYQQRGWTIQRRYHASELSEDVETLEMVEVLRTPT